MVRRGDGVFSEDDIASSPKRAEICSTRSALATTIDRVVRRRFFLGGQKNWGNCKEGILVEKKVLILQLDDTFGFSPHGNLYIFLLVVVVVGVVVAANLLCGYDITILLLLLLLLLAVVVFFWFVSFS